MNPSRPCPVCGGASRQVRYRQRFADGPLGEGYDVVLCASCGAVFADGIPPAEAFERYYAESSKYDYSGRGGAESPYDLRRFEAIADQIEEAVPDKDARLLDIGCATGGLLSVLGRRGYRRLMGADPSEACVAAAIRLHGVEARVGSLGTLPSWPERFDAVLLVGVLEHLPDPLAGIVSAATLLAPGGRIYSAQPDIEAFDSCCNAPYQQFSTEHVTFFSGASLDRLMARAGFAPAARWRWLVEWREGITDSVLSAVHVPASSPARPVDAASGPALGRYLARCQGQEQSLESQIRTLVDSGEPVILWGAGTLARRLLADGPLGRARIAGFIDSSEHLHGRRVAGHVVRGPEWLRGRGERVVIVSAAFEAEILGRVRELAGPGHPVTVLSGAPRAH